MAELLHEAAAALALPLPAGVALTLLLEPSLAQPARPALAASMAIAAIAAMVMCLIPALLGPYLQDQENYYAERAGACPGAPTGGANHDVFST